MEKSSLASTKNDLDFLNEIYFAIDESETDRNRIISSLGKRYNRHKNNKTLVKSRLLPVNLPLIEFPIVNESTHRSFRKQPRYIAKCKSTTAEFFPEYFCRERSGKCFLLDGREWMSPREFKIFSGSLDQSWLRMILIQEIFKSNYDFIRSRGEKRDDRSKADWIQDWKETLKQFLTRTKLLDLHRNCSEYSCLINPINRYIFKSGSLLNSHYSSVANQSFLVHTNPKFTELVLTPYKFDDDKKVKIDADENNEIFSIDSCVFDEISYLDGREPIAYVSANYNERLVKTFTLDDQLRPRLLYKYESREDESSRIKWQCLSPLIRGEMALLINDEIVLLTSESYSRPERLAKDVVPKSSTTAAATFWQRITFAGYLQPRSFLYSDPYQYYLIDSRIRHHSERRDLWTFDLQRTCLAPNEIILQTNWVKKSTHLHLILCSETLVLIDERYASKALLSWRHFMKNDNAPVHLNNSYLAIDDGLNIVSCCNSLNQGFVYQFASSSAQANYSTPPVSYEFALKLDDFTTLATQLNRLKGDCFNRTLNRVLVNSPIVASSHLQTDQNTNSFDLLRLKSNGSLFYESFKLTSDEEIPNDNNTNEVYKSWIHEHDKPTSNKRTDIKRSDSILQKRCSKCFVKVDSKKTSICSKCEKNLGKNLQSERLVNETNNSVKNTNLDMIWNLVNFDMVKDLQQPKNSQFQTITEKLHSIFN